MNGMARANPQHAVKWENHCRALQAQPCDIDCYAMRSMICEFRVPMGYPLPILIVHLKAAIGRAELHSRVHHASRVRAWVRALETIQQQDNRTMTRQIALTLQANVERKKQDPTLEDEVWRYPFQDDLRSLLEARMFVHVVKYLEAKLSPGQWKELISGKLRPEDDKQNTPHRDRLLELYIASAAQAAGMDVDLCEPDIAATVNGQRCGIAVKRVKSRKKLMERAEEGIQQIASSTKHGLVFLDVSNLMNTNMMAMRYLRTFKGAKGGGTVHGHLMRFATENKGLQQLIEDSRVDGIILRHACPAMFGRPFIPATVETWSPIVERPSDITATLYMAMLDALSPDPRPDSSDGPSGYVPCEFYYAHPQHFRVSPRGEMEVQGA